MNELTEVSLATVAYTLVAAENRLRFRRQTPGRHNRRRGAREPRRHIRACVPVLPWPPAAVFSSSAVGKNDVLRVRGVQLPAPPATESSVASPIRPG